MANNALLNMQPITLAQGGYKDPRAGTLFGSGNSNISDDDIRAFIGSAGNNQNVMDAALKYGVSVDQIDRAMGGKGGFDTNTMTGYVKDQGINTDRNPDTTLDIAQIVSPLLLQDQKPVTPVTVNPTPVQFNPATDTVQGRLDGVLDPNNPLMKRAETMGLQAANRRGLLNSSIGVSAAQSALTDAALQIATPDANAYSQGKMQDAQAGTQASLANAQNNLTAGMFNNDLNFKTGSTNAQNLLDASKFNAQNVNSFLSQSQDNKNKIDLTNLNNQNSINLTKLDNDNKLALANIEAKYQLQLQGSASSSKLFGDVMQLATQISTSDLSEDAKQKNINNLFSFLDAGLSFNKDFANLGNDLNFAPSSETRGLLNQLPGGATGAGNAGNTALSESGSTASGNTSVLTGNELGQPSANQNVTNTLSGTISTVAANRLKEAYKINPAFLVGADATTQSMLAYGNAGLQQSNVQLDRDTANRYRQIDWDVVSQKFKEGLANNSIYKIPVRDPQYGVLLDKSFAEFDTPFVYYDPNNVLGLRV